MKRRRGGGGGWNAWSGCSEDAVLELLGGAAAAFAVFVTVVFASRSVAGPAARGADAAGTAVRVAASEEAGRRPPTVVVGMSDYGRIVFDGERRALFAFTRPTRADGVHDACADTSPPYLVEGASRAGAGTDRVLLGSIRRADGRRQVRYAGRPPY